MCGGFAINSKKKSRQSIDYRDFLVRLKGLEPPRLSAPDPKSGAAANYATSAFYFKLDRKDIVFLDAKTFFLLSNEHFNTLIVSIF